MLPQFYSLNEYLQNTFGQKVYKLALNGGMSCPNRDGLIDTRGCIFCSEGGSGEFAAGSTSRGTPSSIPGITEQIHIAQDLVKSKYSGHNYIAYFQAFTNTYASVDYLRRIYTEAISHPDVICLSIATRPDCLNAEIITLLSELNTIKPVWIELGLQTIHEESAKYIRRGYPLAVFEECLSRLNAAHIDTIVHMIIGLPGENPQDIYETARYLAKCNLQGVKLQLLHVLKGTDLAKDYENGQFEVLTIDEYITILGHIIELLPKNFVIHRLTGDGPKNQLIAPLWSADKKNVLNSIQRHFKQNEIEQGKCFNAQD